MRLIGSTSASYCLLYADLKESHSLFTSAVNGEASAAMIALQTTASRNIGMTENYTDVLDRL